VNIDEQGRLRTPIFSDLKGVSEPKPTNMSWIIQKQILRNVCPVPNGKHEVEILQPIRRIAKRSAPAAVIIINVHLGIPPRSSPLAVYSLQNKYPIKNVTRD
jgi:hypothetical protein